MFEKYSDWWYKRYWKKFAKMYISLGEYEIIYDKTKPDKPYVISSWHYGFECKYDLDDSYETKQEALDYIYARRLESLLSRSSYHARKREVICKIPPGGKQ